MATLEVDKPSGKPDGAQARAEFDKHADDVFMQRKVRGNRKTTPDMLYPICSQSRPVPRHKVLEDDWRAFRNVFHNSLNQVMATLEKSRGKTDYRHKLEPYKSAVDLPKGYLYRMYREGMKRQPVKGKRLPVVVFDGPYQKMNHIHSANRALGAWQREQASYDPDLLIFEGSGGQMYPYNEPETVPDGAMNVDYSKPLFLRVLNILEKSSANRALPQAPLLRQMSQQAGFQSGLMSTPVINAALESPGLRGGLLSELSRGSSPGGHFSRPKGRRHGSKRLSDEVDKPLAYY